MGFKKFLRIILSIFVLHIIFLVAGTASATTVHAATITVTTTVDELNTNGECSLREAIKAANTDVSVDSCTSGSGADQITLPSGNYTLSIPGQMEDANATGDLDITSDLTISGVSPASTIIDANHIDRVLEVRPLSVVHISGLTIRGGYRQDDVDPLFSGGGIYNRGNLSITDTSISNNSVGSFSGGGIVNVGTLNITNSTITGNFAGDVSGILSGGNMTLTNVTISNNRADDSGALRIGGNSTLINVTIADNISDDPAGLDISGNNITISNSIIANNVTRSGAHLNCSNEFGHLVSLGHNIDSDGTCGLTGVGDLSNIDPLYEQLADNGGPTWTNALLSGSPAIDAGDDAACPLTDQRGVARPQGSHCDIGAYEFIFTNSAPIVGVITAPVAPVLVNTSVNASASFSDQDVSDTHSAIWDWGDGNTSSGTVTESNGSGNVTGLHSYLAAGVYEVNVTVTDNNGASDQPDNPFRYVVVYDPAGGFVTGAGRFDMPAGSIITEPTRSGMTNFGTNAKYVNNVLTGATRLNFRDGPYQFDFDSTSYDWLVVTNGNLAHLHGTGTVNGVAGYSFDLFALDNAPDTIRMQIKDVNGSVVFDNNTSNLTNGNIDVHN